jgi:hypothetical protein
MRLPPAKPSVGALFFSKRKARVYRWLISRGRSVLAPVTIARDMRYKTPRLLPFETLEARLHPLIRGLPARKSGHPAAHVSWHSFCGGILFADVNNVNHIIGDHFAMIHHYLSCRY